MQAGGVAEMGWVHQVLACFGALCAPFVRHLLCCWLLTYSWSFTFELFLPAFASTAMSHCHLVGEVFSKRLVGGGRLLTVAAFCRREDNDEY